MRLPCLRRPTRPARGTLREAMRTQPSTHPGDDGHSDLLSGSRPPKNDSVFECLGWLDELNAAIGHLRVAVRARGDKLGGELDSHLRGVQLVLGRMMATVASAAPDSPGSGTHGAVDQTDVSAVERLESRLRDLTPLRPAFHVPGDGSEASALADVARARCRTAERAIVGFVHPDQTGGRADLAPAQRYLNRLSDYLFMMARHLDSRR